MDAPVVQQMLDGGVHKPVLGEQRQAVELGSTHGRRQVIAAAEIDDGHVPAGERALEQLLNLFLQRHARRLAGRVRGRSAPDRVAYTSTRATYRA